MAKFNPFEINKSREKKINEVTTEGQKDVVIDENLDIQIDEKPKRDENKRTRNKQFHIRFSSDELKEIEEKYAKSKEKNKSDFILKAVRDMEIVVIEDLKFTSSELRKQGVNINQIAKTLNQLLIMRNMKTPDYDEQEIINKTIKQLNELKKDYTETLKKVNEISQKIL